MQISLATLKRSIYEDSFFEFVKGFWPVIISENPVYNWHIEYLCNELQSVGERVIAGLPRAYDLIINVPPGTTKSTICSQMFQPWLWTRMPSTKMISGSYVQRLAIKMSMKSRDIVQSELYQDLWPRIRIKEDQNRQDEWSNTDNGMRLACGSGGNVMGYHAHVIMVDDPIDPEGSFSEMEIDHVNRWMRETLPSRMVDKDATVTILIMQRLHPNDPSGEWMERTLGKGIRHICLPAELPQAGGDAEKEMSPWNAGHVSPPELVNKYVDGLMDPVRMSKSAIQNKRQALGEFGYAAQFEQRPTPRGGHMFKCEELKVEAPPSHFVKRVRYWDKAGTMDAGAYTAGVLMGIDRKGMYWVLDVVRGQWDAGRREEIIKATAGLDTTVIDIGVEQEPGSSGKESAQGTIKRLAGYKVIADCPTGSKVRRADTFAVQINIGNVRMAPGEWNREYSNELLYFPHSKYKDQVDASSGAFGMLTKQRRKKGAM